LLDNKKFSSKKFFIDQIRHLIIGMINKGTNHTSTIRYALGESGSFGQARNKP
jgi:hypothetical protein